MKFQSKLFLFSLLIVVTMVMGIDWLVIAAGRGCPGHDVGQDNERWHIASEMKDSSGNSLGYAARTSYTYRAEPQCVQPIRPTLAQANEDAMNLCRVSGESERCPD